mmetsp:Transcript_4295/g.7166  ORF Transcript_4295/g.7166 Transcript_4295/m.7166 type:complete len:183 (-) Transcript_4295:211-759(-)|eukprot:CAMPEP_0119003836 /NCGR_PEP_ID=MMETSP1176-20130426/792_1 /TAXON_ID=265551 /ORGANISM="Synedropsis recta cf, Strain CCMP1620" /LENGTH=182 /DNA_ID=CAMNT_0006955473 /DNA_START=134 /DNA_END=682 /DNA_ORIENTATION=+
MTARFLCLLLVTFGAVGPAEGLEISTMHQRNNVYTNRLLSHQQQRGQSSMIKGRLGHLRPRLWATAVAEEASPTSLQAALKCKNFEEMLKNFRDTLIIVTFSADLCGPCRLMKKELSQVSEVIGEDKVKIVAIDTERFPKLGARYDISVLPTVVIFKEGEIHDRIEGLETAESMLERLRTLL